MNQGMIERIEGSVRRCAAASFAGAAAYAAYGITTASGASPVVGLLAAAGGGVAYLPCSRFLGAVGLGGQQFNLQAFELTSYEPSEAAEELILEASDRIGAAELVLTAEDRMRTPHELLLTDADRLQSPVPLLLDDVLEAIDTDSRVVRLFDRKAMPTPGQLQTRVVNHLAATSAGRTQADASKALSQALAELRSSLG